MYPYTDVYSTHIYTNIFTHTHIYMYTESQAVTPNIPNIQLYTHVHKSLLTQMNTYEHTHKGRQTVKPTDSQICNIFIHLSRHAHTKIHT